MIEDEMAMHETNRWSPDLAALSEATCPWKVGDKVQRQPGSSYDFPGVVIGVNLKLNGTTWHCEVEAFAPGFEGCTHVFPASGLVAMDPKYEDLVPTASDLAALSAAATRATALKACVMDIWQITLLFGAGDDARDRMRAFYDAYRAGRLVQIDEGMREKLDNLGPFTFSVVHSENYSGEHREWEEPGYTLPRGAKLIRTIADAAIAAMMGGE